MRSVGALLRGRTTWIVAAAVGALAWVQAVVAAPEVSLTRRLALTVVPLAVLTVSTTMALWRRRWVALGALLLAVSPAAWSAVAAGQWPGAAAVVAASSGIWLDGRSLPVRARRPAVVLAAAGAVVLAAGWVAGTDRRVGPSPSFEAMLSQVGDVVRGAVGWVGEWDTPIPVTAQLTWWVGAGTVTASAILAGRATRAWAVPLAAAVLAVLAAVTIRWRGPVDATGGTWILAAGVAVAGAAGERSRLTDRRLARVLVIIGASTCVAGVVQQVRWATIVATGADNSWPWWDWPPLLTTSIDSRILLAVGVVAAAAVPVLVWLATRRRGLPRGVNLVGYFDAPSGLGERARTLAAALRAAGVPVGEHPLSASASAGERYDTTVAVVTARALPGIAASLPELFTGVDRVVGYWFWELEEAPDDHRHALQIVDEVWAPTTFVARAYTALARRTVARPVRLVRLPVPEPHPGSLERRELGIADDAFLFVTTFDHLSVMERKNPLGVIAAFREAFTAGDDVALVVKTVNADSRPEAADRLASAAAGDRRVRVLDDAWPAERLFALLAEADALVNLHRSEGLGLQPAEAMWLGTPVIVTAYAGVLDLLDDECAALVPATSVTVGDDGDDAYPPESWWAEPDLHAAAAAMRRLADDPAYGRALAAAARARMLAQADPAAAGESIAARLWWLSPPAPRSAETASPHGTSGGIL